MEIIFLEWPIISYMYEKLLNVIETNIRLKLEFKQLRALPHTLSSTLPRAEWLDK